MSKAAVKKGLHTTLTTLWLRPGTARRSLVGPYRGLTFGLSAPLMNRIGIFYKTYEPNVSEWLSEVVRPGMTVYVVGAHVGIHVLHIAQLLKGQGAIHAFEAWPENYASLEWNIRLNMALGVPITPHPVAVARESGVIHMAEGSSDGKHHIAEAGEARQIEVQATSLDDFWAGSGCPDLVLIDIEGFEHDALEGGQKMLQACKPRLALEHHGKQETLLAWLNQHGYTVQRTDSRHIFTA
jgi:FkbM family methyltransferase